jgi:hypothetical protein
VAQATQFGLSVRIEAGHELPSRADPEGERSPPIVESLMFDAHIQRRSLDLT